VWTSSVIHTASATGALSFGFFSLSALQQTIDRASKEKKQKPEFVSERENLSGSGFL
jgi:hypothetical protein